MADRLPVGDGRSEDGLLGPVAARARAGREALARCDGAALSVAAVECDGVGLGGPLGVEREVRGRACQLELGAIGISSTCAVGGRVPAGEVVARTREGVRVEGHRVVVLEALIFHRPRRTIRVGVEVHRHVPLDPDCNEGDVSRNREAFDPREVSLTVDGRGRLAVLVGDGPAAKGVRSFLGREGTRKGRGLVARGDGEGALPRLALLEGALVALEVGYGEGVRPLGQEDDVVALDLPGARRLGREARLLDALAAAVRVADGPARQRAARKRRHDDGIVVGAAAVPDGLAVLAAHGAQGAVAGGEGHGDTVRVPLGVEVNDGTVAVAQAVHEALRTGGGKRGVGGALNHPAHPVVAGALEAVGDVDRLAILDRDLEVQT